VKVNIAHCLDMIITIMLV